MSDLQKLVTHEDTAEILGYAPATLRNLRSNGGLPLPYIKFNNGRVMYQLDDIRDFIAQNRRTSDNSRSPGDHRCMADPSDVARGRRLADAE